MPKHHLWRCTPGRIELETFDTGTPATGCGFQRWLMIEEGIPEGYAYVHMLNSETWLWQRPEQKESA